MSLIFYLCSFVINLWHQKFVTAHLTAVFVNNQHGILRQRPNFDKKFVFEGVHSKEVETSFLGKAGQSVMLII